MLSQRKWLFKKYIIMKWTEQFARQKEWWRTAKRYEKKKKVLLWSLHVFDTPEPQLKAQFNAAAGTSCPTALKCSTKSQSSTEMDKVVYDLYSIIYTYIYLYMTYVDWIIPEISFHYLNFFFFFSVYKNKMCRFVWKRCYRGNKESTST